jgi:hypothetical protein
MVWLRSTLLWDVAQCRLVAGYQCFGMMLSVPSSRVNRSKKKAGNRWMGEYTGKWCEW